MNPDDPGNLIMRSPFVMLVSVCKAINYAQSVAGWHGVLRLCQAAYRRES